MKRTLSQKFQKQKPSDFGDVAVQDSTKGGTRKIRASVRFVLHGVQNIAQHEHMVDEIAQLFWKRGSKKANQGSTSKEAVVFGMSTFKHTVEFPDVTFVQDKTSKDVEEKSMSITLKVAARGSKKMAAMGTKNLDLAEFYRDGTRVDKIFSLTHGSNPVTLKVTIEVRWTHIDNKLIVRGKSGRIVGGDDEDESYDLKTVTFDSEEDISIAGADFSEDEDMLSQDDGPGPDVALELAVLKKELEEARALNEQLRADAKRAEEKIETYRTTVKTKNDQIADLKESRDEKTAQAGTAESRIASANEKTAAVQAKLEAHVKIVHDLESKLETQRDHFDRQMRELRERNEQLHEELAKETSSNAQFLQAVEKQTAEASRALEEEKEARREAEKELAQVTRREESLVAELEEVLPVEAVDEAKEEEEESASSSSSSSVASKDVGGAVIGVIRNRRRAEREAKKRTPTKKKEAKKADEDWAAKHRAAMAEVARLRAQLAERTAEVSTLKDQLAAQKSSQDSSSSALLDERDAARRDLEAARERVRELEKEGSAAQTEMEALQKRNVALAESVRTSLEARAKANSAMLTMREESSRIAAEISTKQRELSVAASVQQSQVEQLRTQAATQLQEMEMKHVAEVEGLRDEMKHLQKQLDEKDKQVAATQTTPRGGTVVDAAIALGKGVAGGEAAALRQSYSRERLEYERIAERAKEDARRAEDEMVRMERRALQAEKSLAEARRVANVAQSRAAEAAAQYEALKEQAEDREQVLQSAEKEFIALAAQESDLKAALRDKEMLVEQLQIRVEASLKTSAAAVQQAEASHKRVQSTEQALEAREAQHKKEMATSRQRVADLRSEARTAADQVKAVETERDAALRKVALLEKEVAASFEVEKEMSAELTASETKLRAAMRELAVAQDELTSKEHQVAQSESLAVEVDAKRTSLQELSERVIKTEEQLKSKERTLKEERTKNDSLHEQLTAAEAAKAELQKQVANLQEEAKAAAEQDRVMDEMLERKNGNISALEKEMEEVEAEVSVLQSQLSSFKKQTKEREAEVESLRDRAEADAALVKQLQAKMSEADQEDAASRSEAIQKAAALEQNVAEAKKQVKEAQLAADTAARERDALRTRVTDVEQQLEEEQARAAASAQAAERVQELTKELEHVQHELETRQAETPTTSVSPKEMQQLEKEKRERKLVISTIFLGASADGGALIGQCAKLIVQSLIEWGALMGEGDGVCLSKVANGYTLLLQTSKHSYHHCIRVLAQVCALSHELSSELAINDPALHGVVSTKGRTPGQGNVGAFVDKLEAAVEKTFAATVKAIFRRLNAYLAPAMLNHLPAIDENRIEETVVDSGSERGKFMMHTILSTLSDVRDLLTSYELPPPVVEQLYTTLASNVNAYLFTYLIQTPVICAPGNAFTIKTRLGLLDDWFGQQKNERLARAYEQFKPMDEAAMLLFVDRESFTSWSTIRSLCPSLNELQVLSLVEMLSEDETQKVPLGAGVRDEIDKVVLNAEDQKLFFAPVDLIQYKE